MTWFGFGISHLNTLLSKPELRESRLDQVYAAGPHCASVIRENSFKVPEESAKSAFSKAFNSNLSLPYSFSHAFPR
jgi:hypothetical protein